MNHEEYSFPEFSPPNNGLHRYLFRYASMCAEEDIPLEDCQIQLEECVDNLNYDRYVPPREITAAVADAYRWVLDGPPSETSARLPKYDNQAAKEIHQEWMTTIDDLEKASDKRPPSEPLEAIRQLFGTDDLICIAKEINKPSVVSYKNLEKALMINCALKPQYIVPNPMRAKEGMSKDNRPSKRCLDNTGRKERCVFDFDAPKPIMHPSLVAYLSDYCGFLPEAVIHSGNKSLHAWWNCKDWSTQDIQTFEEEAARVGADPALLGDSGRCQFVRMPGGYRDNGKRQIIHFWNPNPQNHE